MRTEASTRLHSELPHLASLFSILLFAAAAPRALAGDRSEARCGAPHSSISFMGWDAGTPIFKKVTIWDTADDPKEAYFRLRDGKRLPIQKSLATAIASLPQGSAFPLQLVNLDQAKMQILDDAVQRSAAGKWPKDKPFPSVEARLEIHFKDERGADQILWQGTRTVRMYCDKKTGPTAAYPDIDRGWLSPDGNTATAVLVVNDVWEPLLLRFRGRSLRSSVPAESTAGDQSAAPSLASLGSQEPHATPSSSVSFLGWHADAAIFQKVTTWEPEGGGEKDEYFQMIDGERLPVRLKPLGPIESLPRGTAADNPPLGLVNLDESKIKVVDDAVELLVAGKWPKKKALPTVKVRLSLHFKDAAGTDHVLWQGTRTVRTYFDDEWGPKAGYPRVAEAWISPDGRTLAVVLVVNDTWEPLSLRLDGK